MKINGDTLRQLGALNLSPEQMAGVLGILADGMEADEARRKAGAEKKRRQRLAEHPSPVPGTVPGTNEGLSPGQGGGHVGDVTGDNPLETESFPTPLQRTQTPSKERPLWGPKKGTRLPADWAPDVPYGLGQGMLQPAIMREAERFRNYWASQPGQRGVRLDWAAVWRNWVLKAVDGRSTGPGPSVNGHDEPNWKQRTELYEKGKIWLGMWGSPKRAPEEFQSRLKDVQWP